VTSGARYYYAARPLARGQRLTRARPHG